MNDKEERYALTPKGYACLAALKSGLIDNIHDERFEEFWELFLENFEEVSDDNG